MTRTSAEPPVRSARLPRRARAARAQAGFTLLEVMVTVGIVGTLILPILGVREHATARVYRASNMLEATRHGQELLAQRLRNPASSDSENGVIEDAPEFRYELTIEDYDLSLGYSDDEEIQDRDGDGFPDDVNVPGDATDNDEPEERTPHKWRRYELTITWDGFADESEDEVVLEGFVPRIWDDEDDLLDNN
jgi:prepilin-type N-terminal cleavage/methylation domain-containing protein